MRDNLEPDSLKQRRILGGIETGMVERIAAIAADRFAVTRASVEHQRSARSGVFAEHVEHSALVGRREMDKLSHARMPWNHCFKDSVRISPTIHVCAGKRLRHSEINFGEESTPVILRPCAAICRATGLPDPHPRSSALAPFASMAMKRSSQGLSFHAPRLRSSSQAIAWRS